MNLQENDIQIVNLNTDNYGLQAIGKTGFDNEAVGKAMQSGTNIMCAQYGGKFCKKLINLNDVQF